MASDVEIDPNESNADKVTRLLAEGLELYGEDQVSSAIQIWREVLRLDPGNGEAIDFLESADRRSVPRPENGDEDQVAAIQKDVVEEARRLVAASQFEESLELLRSAVDTSRFCLEVEATIELVRSNLFQSYTESIGDMLGVPALATDPSEITKFNLPSNAGFFLSLVDGVTDLESLVTVSGMDGFEALRTTKHLIDLGIVRMQA